MKSVSFLTLLYLIVAVRSYSGVQTILTNVAKAKLIIDSHGTIWEPNPPSDEFFVLGQYFHRKRERPDLKTQLIVGRSEDNSLAAPLDFYGKWTVVPGFNAWTMRCPVGYVSLGAIATAKHTKPDTTKYRCVKEEETVQAKMWEAVETEPDCELKTIYSPDGWSNNFFVVKYANTTMIETKAYTLKTRPVTLSSLMKKNHDNNENEFPQTINRLSPYSPSAKGIKKDNQEDNGLQSYIILFISGGFVVLIIIIVITLFCIKSNRTKVREQSTTTSTGMTGLDSGVPSTADYSSSSDTSVNGVGGNNRRTSLLNFHPGNHVRSESVTRFNEIYEPRSAEFEEQQNILYHSINPVQSDENEYQIIKVEPLPGIQESDSPVIDRAASAYSFAV